MTIFSNIINFFRGFFNSQSRVYPNQSSQEIDNRFNNCVRINSSNQSSINKNQPLNVDLDPIMINWQETSQDYNKDSNKSLRRRLLVLSKEMRARQDTPSKEEEAYKPRRVDSFAEKVLEKRLKLSEKPKSR